MSDTMVSHVESAAINRSAPKRAWRLRNLLMLRPKAKAAIGYGALSVGLYFGLYTFNADIRHIAEMTNQGDKTYFLLPIGIAFLFSVVHGLFTDRFWDALGLKAKR